MTQTYEMLEKAITVKKNRKALTEKYINDTKDKMDVFLMADRITENEYNELLILME